MNPVEPERIEFLNLAISIEATDVGACHEIKRLLKRGKERSENSDGNPPFLIEEVSEQSPSFGAFEPSFWVDFVMKVPVSIAVTVLSTWLCEVVKDARSKRKSSSDKKESIHIGGITINFDGDE